MAFAQRIITSNSAGDQEFTFTFDYIKEEHIKVFVNFVEKAQGTGSNEFQVITNTTPKKVRLNTGLASANTRVEIRRISSLSTPLVDFTDGSTLTATDLDTAEKQSLFIDQELDDALKQGVSIDASTGLPSLTNQRLSNVADPVSAQDVVTKAYLERSGSITSTQIADGTIVNGDIANATITGAKLVNDTVTATQIAANAVTASELANNAVDTNAIVDGNVTRVKIAADAIDGTKIADNAIANEHIADNAINSEHYVDGSIDRVHLAADIVDGTKIADDSINSEHYVADSIDTEHYAPGSVDATALASSAVTNSKIANAAVTGAKLSSNSVGNGMIVANAVTTGKIADAQITTSKIANDAVTTGKIADAELKTLAGMQSATASKLASSTALTSDLADLNQLDGMTKQTTITDDDTKFPTSGAVVDFVAAQIAPLGGLEVIATDAAFPNTQPSSGVVISISDAGGVVFNGSGTSTTPRTVGGATVTINNAPSSLNNETLAAGVGLMVSSRGAGQIYNYHKILGKEDDIKQLSDDINDFNARYRVVDSNPTSNNDAGDLIFNRSTQKLLVFNATSNAFEEAQSVGNFFISTLSPAFDGSTQDFTITNAPANAQQILLSINGVIQKPNSGTSTPSEGFALTGNTVKLAAAPPTGSTYFAIVLGSTVNIGTPSNNTVSTAIIQNGAVTGEKLASNLDLIDNQKIRLGTGNDLEIFHDGSATRIVNSNGNLLLDASSSSGDVYINSGDDIFIRPKGNTGTENGITVIGDGAVELYYDNSKKLETHTNGVNIYGRLLLADSSGVNDNRVRLGNQGDLSIYHDGTHSYLHNLTGELKNIAAIWKVVNAANSEIQIKATQNAAVELYYDHSKKLETTSTGSTIQGVIRADASITGTPHLFNYGRGGQATAGLSLYGAESAIEIVSNEDGTHGGSLLIRTVTDGAGFVYNPTDNALELKLFSPTADNFAIHGAGGNVTMDTQFRAVKDGAVELYHDGTKRFETISNGNKITGVLQIDRGSAADEALSVDTTSTSGATRITIKESGVAKGEFAYSHGNDQVELIGKTGNGAAIIVNQNQTALHINSDGYVTKPKNPIFHAFGGPSDVSANTDIVFSQERFDVGGGYNTSNGIYTVPRTGYYHFYGQVYRQNTSGDSWWGFYINDSQKSEARMQTDHAQTGGTGKGYATLQSSLYWYCSAGDEVKMRCGTSGNIHCNNTLSYFCGNLVG